MPSSRHIWTVVKASVFNRKNPDKSIKFIVDNLSGIAYFRRGDGYYYMKWDLNDPLLFINYVRKTYIRKTHVEITREWPAVYA